MTVVMRFFRWIWRKITCWVFFWKHKAKTTILEHPDSKKNVLKVEKTSKVVETFKLVEPSKEAEVFKTHECPKVADPCMLAKVTDGAEVKGGRGGRSLLQLPQTAVKSVSTLMVSALQSGWQMCSWKSSMSSTSITSKVRTKSPLESPEAEMLREVYLVLWAIRKQLRQLASRQEKRRRRHYLQAHTSPQPDPVQGLRQDARSPL
ncbi:PREDICTED: uncharacterized protein C7orf61 homolog [Ceratotherium simum simum]|uniref:Uncharacterized protein C7orf61 homolog n=1 Tax=Ceratotherium simum simum TaxID=73337 RepID=A0ABM1DLE1_CERSS|nr:PREDICTED: uncharacterized protein C7orf61 homolog [Ceratotherium simum simum]